MHKGGVYRMYEGGVQNKSRELYRFCRMFHRVRCFVGVLVLLAFFVYPIMNWLQQSEAIATTLRYASTGPSHTPSTEIRRYSYLIQRSGPFPPKNLADWSTVKINATREKGCQPKMNLVYLKTHKTASSSLQNIVYRWGERNNLTFALPTSGVQIRYPLTRKGLVRSPSGRYNILANHARFEPKAFQEVMPADATFITILRDPKRQYKSHYNYFHCQDPRFYGVSLHKFLGDPQRYLDFATHRKLKNKMCVDAIQNPQLYDLGFNSVRQRQDSPALFSSVAEWIDVLDKSFHLVLIADYFKESLVVLKDIMCWDIDDVVVFDVNRSPISATPILEQADEDNTNVTGLIEKWNAGDVKLYRHFNQTLWKRLDLIGRDVVSRESAAIQKRTYELVNRCLDDIEWISDTEYRSKYAYRTPLKNVVLSYTLKRSAQNNPLCQRMVLAAPNYLEFLRRKMKEISL